MSYAATLYESIDAVPADEWNRVSSAAPNPLVDLRLLAVVASSMASEGKFSYLLLRDDAGRPMACAALCLYRVDGAVLGNSALKKFTSLVRRAWKNYLHVKVLFCGLPLSTGQSHVAVHPEADPTAVAAALDKALDELARREGSWFIVAKEFDERDIERFDALRECGYLRLDSLSMNHFPPRFRDLEHFRGSLRSHYRYKIKKSLKKMELAGLVVDHLTNPAEIVSLYTENVHQLYVSVVERAEHRLEILPIDFFRQLVRQFPGEASLTVVRDQGRVVAFGWGLLSGTVYRNLFVGIDYALNEETDVYFNMMLYDIDFALRKGVTEIFVGQTADDFKSRLGCYQTRRYLYLKATNRLWRAFLRHSASLAFPAAPPAPRRELFKPSTTEEPVATVHT